MIREFLLNELHNNEFFKGGAVITILTGIGFWLKSFFPWIWGRIRRQFSYTMCIESKTDIYLIFNWWLKNNHSDKYKKVLISVECENRWQENEIKKYKLEENNFDSSFYFWRNGTPIFLQSSREKMEGAHYIGDAYIDRYVLTTYFNRHTLKNLLQDIIEEYNRSLKQKTVSYFYDYKNNQGWDKTGELNVKPFDKIFNREKNELLEDITEFLNSEEYYRDRGILYRRSYLAEGSPGNGKTSTILALADLLKKDVYSLNMSALNDTDQLKYAFQGIKENSFLLLEDLDCTVNGREKINDKINFSTVLNVLDGVYSKKGICTFFTTNHANKLDEALTRCGRMDKKITFENPNRKDVEDMLQLFFGEKRELKNYNNKYSAAQIQEFFIKSETADEAIDKITCTTFSMNQ